MMIVTFVYNFPRGDSVQKCLDFTGLKQINDRNNHRRQKCSGEGDAVLKL